MHSQIKWPILIWMDRVDYIMLYEDIMKYNSIIANVQINTTKFLLEIHKKTLLLAHADIQI